MDKYFAERGSIFFGHFWGADAHTDTHTHTHTHKQAGTHSLDIRVIRY